MNDIALIGLAVMGQNLVLNMARNGLAVTVYNRTRERTEAFLGGPAKGQSITPAWDIFYFMLLNISLHKSGRGQHYYQHTSFVLRFKRTCYRYGSAVKVF